MHGLLKDLACKVFGSRPVDTPRLNQVMQLYSQTATSDPDTIKKNLRVFKLFIEQVGNLCCHEVSRMMVTQFQASLRESGKAVATIRSYCGSLSSVFGWATENIDGFPANPCKGVRLPRLPKCEPTFWDREDMARLHAAIDNPPRLEMARFLPWSDAVCRLQWHGLIQVADDCGLRIAELLNLRWVDIELDPKEGKPIIHVRHRNAEVGNCWSWGTKGRRDRTLSLPHASVEILRRMEVACPWTYPFLPKERCERLQARATELPLGVCKRPYSGLYRIWNRIKSAANVKGDGAFHRMRRTAATELGEHLTVPQLQEHFGWQDLSTPLRYVGVRRQAQIEAVAKAQAARTAGEGI